MVNQDAFCFDIIDALTDRELAIIAKGDPEQIGAIRQRFRTIKGKLGAMKYEGKDQFIAEFVGLAAKMYTAYSSSLLTVV